MAEVTHIFDKIISLENLFLAWQEFKKGKRKKKDVIEFEFNLEDNIFKLHWLLESNHYRHDRYQCFSICDPKPRTIHKASVRDRILHHAVFRVLYPIFDPSFIYDSYSCRLNKGTHRGVDRLGRFAERAGRHYRNNCFILKCDISKFFASIDHDILKNLIRRPISDARALKLLDIIIDSYNNKNFGHKKGVPLGNLTSQLFANIYLNELDNFIKHNLKIKSYLRYTDDFIMVHQDENYLKKLIPKINEFLKKNLKLDLHPEKVTIRKFGQGADFLGYVTLPFYRVLRTKTKRRMFKKLEFRSLQADAGEISGQSFEQVRQSYLGVLRHCSSAGLKKLILPGRLNKQN
jgi:RNA-directed DNA polymerase